MCSGGLYQNVGFQRVPIQGSIYESRAPLSMLLAHPTRGVFTLFVDFPPHPRVTGSTIMCKDPWMGVIRNSTDNMCSFCCKLFSSGRWGTHFSHSLRELVGACAWVKVVAAEGGLSEKIFFKCMQCFPSELQLLA